MRVGARKGFACHSVKVVLLANSIRYEVDSNTSCVKVPSIRFKYCPFLALAFLKYIHICCL